MMNDDEDRITWLGWACLFVGLVIFVVVGLNYQVVSPNVVQVERK